MVLVTLNPVISLCIERDSGQINERTQVHAQCTLHEFQCCLTLYVEGLGSFLPVLQERRLEISSGFGIERRWLKRVFTSLDFSLSLTERLPSSFAVLLSIHR